MQGLLGGLGGLLGAAGDSAGGSASQVQQANNSYFQQLTALSSVQQRPETPDERYIRLARKFDWDRAFDRRYVDEFFAANQ